MNRKSLDAKLTISRVHSGASGDSIEVRIQDVASRIEFVSASIGMEEFAAALTGLSYVDCEAEVRGLESVGKTLETEELVFPLPISADYTNRKKLAIGMLDEKTPDGWTADRYFGSQSSFFTDSSGVMHARTIIRRYV